MHHAYKLAMYYSAFYFLDVDCYQKLINLLKSVWGQSWDSVTTATTTTTITGTNTTTTVCQLVSVEAKHMLKHIIKICWELVFVFLIINWLLLAGCEPEQSWIPRLF